MNAPWYRDFKAGELPRFTTPEGVTVTVIAVGNRDRNAVYEAALSRLRDPKTP
jgi:redox-sensitive bicupin YhaK (pirin superfamily)